jgi:predicted AlkP superfamily phosphohydrolase/phosphomutase
VWLDGAEELMRERIGDCVGLSELAEAIGAHPTHLARTFRARYGVSVGEYSRRLRLAWAARENERVRGKLKQEFEALGDDKGRPIGTVAHLPEELYPQRNGIAPDLLVYFGDLLWRSVGQVGTGTVHVFENDTGLDDANHAHEGLYVLAAEDGPLGPGPERDLRDVAPTILQLLGEPVPADMEGVSMLASANI